MMFSKKKPPIKITLKVENFNKLSEFLVSIIDIGNKDSELAEKLKTKFLRYSIPYLRDDETLIDIQLFNKEAEVLLSLLLYNAINNFSAKTNYYNVLMKVRDMQKQNYN